MSLLRSSLQSSVLTGRGETSFRQKKFPRVIRLGNREIGASLVGQTCSRRQLLGFGIAVEELEKLRIEIVKREGNETGEAIVHLISLILDKFLKLQ